MTFGLRQKLALGFGGLLAILLTMGILASVVLNQYSSTLETLFHENYKSVVYAQSMKDAVDEINEIIQQSLWNSEENAQIILFQKPISRFETQLNLEKSNITIPGEAKLVSSLQASWLLYREHLNEISNLTSEVERRAYYKTSLRSYQHELKSLAQDIIDINLGNITSVDGKAKESAKVARKAMAALIVTGITIAILFVSLIGRSILKPLRTLTQSAQEIGNGNLNLLITGQSKDELGQLAAAFNTMASRLREYRHSDRARLFRTQKTTQIAINTFPDAVSIIGLDGKVELSNDIAQCFGLEQGSDLSKSGIKGVWAMFQQVYSTLQAVHPKGYEFVIQSFHAGHEQFYLPQAVPVLDEEKTLAGVTLILSDVTDLRRLDEMKSNLLSVVSHELKTPLTSIRMATHLLLEERAGSINPKQAELLCAASEDAERLNGIIERLLDIGRIESGRVAMEMKPIRADALIADTVAQYSAAYRDKSVTLRNETDLDLPSVMADMSRIGHVFSNLLDNALKYTPSGGEVQISASVEDGFVAFLIRDSGPGIPPEALPHVFERFYRVQGQGLEIKGAGLGLAIAREIVEAHGGKISASNNESAGACFSFTLKSAQEKHV